MVPTLGSGNLHSVLPVPVEDQKPRNRAKRKGLPRLLHNPLARRMLGDVAVQDAPPVMSDHEKTVQHAKPDGGNRKEIHRGNHFLMVAQKGQPSFTWLGVPWRSFHPAGDRSFREVGISSSPWMRGAPQVGFSTTIRKINSRTSFGVGLRPTGPRTREISLQYMRKPARCQRTTVSGVTTMIDCFHCDHSRLTATQKSLSNRLRAGRGRRRFSTISC